MPSKYTQSDNPNQSRLGRLDEKDLRILEEVMRDSKISVELIARKTRIPKPTVDKRLSALLHSGCLERGIRIADWEAAGFPLQYWIDVRVNIRDLQRGRGGLPGDVSRIGSQKKLAAFIAEELVAGYRNDLIVEDVIILLGSPSDLSINIRARDHHSVLRFVTEGLRSLGGIESTMTFHAAWSYSDGPR